MVIKIVANIEELRVNNKVNIILLCNQKTKLLR